MKVNVRNPLPAGYNQGHGAESLRSAEGDGTRSYHFAFGRRRAKRHDRFSGHCVVGNVGGANGAHSLAHCRVKVMQFRLRTLLIVLALGPVVLAGAWWAVRDLTSPRIITNADADGVRLPLTIEP